MLYMYADDVIFVKSFTPFDSIFVSAILNHDIELIAEWSEANGLSLNPTKSQCLTIGSSVLISNV